MAASKRIARLLGAALVCSIPLLSAGEDQAKTPPDNEAGKATISRPSRIRLAGVSIGAAYTHYSGRGYCYPYGFSPFFYSAALPYCLSYYDLYTPFYYPAFYHPGFYNGFARGPNMGEVRLQASSKKAEVFLDGAYAGRAEDLRSIWLEPGAYNLEVKAETRPPFSRRIYVLSGKTLKIDATREEQP